MKRRKDTEGTLLFNIAVAAIFALGVGAYVVLPTTVIQGDYFQSYCDNKYGTGNWTVYETTGDTYSCDSLEHWCNQTDIWGTPFESVHTANGGVISCKFIRGN